MTILHVAVRPAMKVAFPRQPVNDRNYAPVPRVHGLGEMELAPRLAPARAALERVVLLAQRQPDRRARQLEGLAQ